MKVAEVKERINDKLDAITMSAAIIAETFDSEAIIRFKSDLKFIRSFLHFLRLQRNDRNMRLPDKCKYLYHIAGSVAGLTEEHKTDKTTADLMEKARQEWKRHYAPGHISKVKKMLNDYDYARIRPELFDNFFGNVSV
jgi:hypothetical protein